MPSLRALPPASVYFCVGFFFYAGAAACVAGCTAHATATGPAIVSATGGENVADAPPTSSSTSTSIAADEGRAVAWAWTSIGCFVGGAWSAGSTHAGARPEERLAEGEARCREVVTGPLGGKSDDAPALAAVRGLDAATVARVLDAIGESARGMGARKQPLVALVKATAEAAREAMMARRIAEAIRLDFAAKDEPKATAELKGGQGALIAKGALSTLHALGSDEARLVALILAAEHVEAVRGLPPAAKLLAASPAFDVVLATPLPEGAFEFKPGAWLGYVREAAKASGHPAELGANVPNADVEKAAFAGVAAGFADRFEAVAPKLQGPPRDAAERYAARLRVVLAEFAAKSKAKVDAKKTADDAAKKSTEDAAKKSK